MSNSSSFVAMLEAITPQTLELVPGIKEIALEKWLQQAEGMSKLDKLGEINLAQDLDLIDDEEHSKFYSYIQDSFKESEPTKLSGRKSTLKKAQTLFKRATTKIQRVVHEGSGNVDELI